MGHEYRISIKAASPSELKNWLARRGAVFVTFENQEQAEFRFARPDECSGMPDATVVIEKESIYFCFHGGDREKSASVFMGLIDHALTQSGDSVVISTP